jgi:type I restriction enzyme, S subunit
MMKPGYKHTPLGWIPETWDISLVGKICKVGTGTTPSTEVAEFWQNGDIPWMPTGKVNDRIITQAEVFITTEAVKKLKVQLLPIDTVLIAMIGQGQTRGKVALLKVKSWVNQNFAFLIPTNKVLSDYLFSFLEHSYGRIRYEGNRGGSQGSLNSEMVREIKVLLPLLPEQCHIATILSTWDAAITKEQQLINALQNRHRSLTQQLLSGKKRLKDYKHKELKFMTLKSLVKETGERNKRDANIPVLSVTNARGFIMQQEQFNKKVASEDRSNYKIVNNGDFAYNPSRINVGSIDWLRKFEKGLLSPMYVVFKPDISKLVPAFLYHHLKSDNFINRIPMFVQGSVRDTLSFDGICAMRFFIPILTEQTAIAAILTTSDQEIQTHRRHLTALQQQKKGLMQVLLTGKVRVKTA